MMQGTKHTSIELYPYSYIYKGVKTVLIWQTSKLSSDSFKLDSENRLVTSRSEKELKKILGNEFQIVRLSEKKEMNFDKFWKVLSSLREGRSSSTNTCKLLIDGWNFIEDVLKTIGLKKEQKILRLPLLNKTYKKLFYGCNLPSTTPRGKYYEPVWRSNEIIVLRKELKGIWNILRKKGYITP